MMYSFHTVRKVVFSSSWSRAKQSESFDEEWQFSGTNDNVYEQTHEETFS